MKLKWLFVAFIGLLILGVGYMVYVKSGIREQKKYVVLKKDCVMNEEKFKPGSYKMIKLNDGCAICSCISGPEFSCLKADKCPE